MNLKTSTYKFVKSIDRYGNGVSLSYKGKKSYPTFCGGIATIITVLMCFYWWLATALNHYNHHTRNFTQSMKIYSVTNANEQAPVYKLNWYQF